MVLTVVLGGVVGVTVVVTVLIAISQLSTILQFKSIDAIFPSTMGARLLRGIDPAFGLGIVILYGFEQIVVVNLVLQ